MEIALVLKKLRLSLSLLFSILVSAPLCLILIANARELMPLLLLIYLLLGVLPSFMIGFFVLYSVKRLKRHLSEDKNLDVFRFQMSNSCILAALIWGIPSGMAFGFQQPYGTITWAFISVGGAVVGIILGVIISVIIVNEKKKI